VIEGKEEMSWLILMMPFYEETGQKTTEAAFISKAASVLTTTEA
jgi:hypothetical protein